jgi:hypothetical protein
MRDQVGFVYKNQLGAMMVKIVLGHKSVGGQDDSVARPNQVCGRTVGADVIGTTQTGNRVGL